MHMKTPADTTAIAVSVCRRCGNIAKSGITSCCGRGGSWFKRCGGAGNIKLEHTWHEGIQACEGLLQSKTVIVQQLSVQQKDKYGADMANYKSIIAATETFTPTSGNTSMPMPHTTSIVTLSYTPENVSITTAANILMTHTSTNTLITSTTHTSASTLITPHGYENLPKPIARMDIILLSIIVLIV